MRSTPTTPYSDFIYLLDRALRGSQEGIVRGEYNTIIGAYKDYVGKDNANKLFDLNSSIWYFSTFGQVSSWEIYIVVANVNKEYTKNEPVILVDAFMHRRKFIVVIDQAIVDCCYFAGNNIKNYSNEEKTSMISMVYMHLNTAIYLFVKNVVMEGYINPDHRLVSRNLNISNHLTIWYLYNYARIGLDNIKKLLSSTIRSNLYGSKYDDKITDEDINETIELDIKEMEYEGVFNGSFPDIDKLEGGNFRYTLDDPFEKIINRKNIPTSIDPEVENIMNMVKDMTSPKQEYVPEEDFVKTEKLIEEEPPFEDQEFVIKPDTPKKTARKKTTSTSKKTTSSKTSKKKEDATEDGAKD